MKVWHYRALAGMFAWLAALFVRIMIVWVIHPWTAEGTLRINQYEHAALNSLPLLVLIVVFCWVAWSDRFPGNQTIKRNRSEVV